jgi:hypothetical protein
MKKKDNHKMAYDSSLETRQLARVVLILGLLVLIAESFIFVWFFR